MIVAQLMADEDGHDSVLDLSVNKKSTSSNEVILQQNQNFSLLLSPPSSSSSSSAVTSPKQTVKGHKRALESSRSATTTTLASTPPSPILKAPPTGPAPSNKRPLRFQCRHCDYKAPSTSLMQNHIYRHTDLTPYACAYCGHKSTTKSTIMVHIELCHPNMEVKIIENRVREQDFYRDLNSADMTSPVPIIQEPQVKKHRRSNHYDSESAPINGVAISLKAITDDGNESSPGSDEVSETENLEPILFDDFNVLADAAHVDEQHTDLKHSDFLPTMVRPTLKFKTSSQQIPMIEPTSPVAKESDSDDGSEYLLVYNRPKQYYGSLYEPDKQYACKLCSYTTNHRPSMEDHVFVHTNEKPYKCGYCGEEIYTRYAATYHIKYKHAGMARNFIQNKADVTQYYINRAKKEDEKNQFKVIDTRRVKVPTRHGISVFQQQQKNDFNLERSVPSPSRTVVSPSPPPTQVPTPLTQIPMPPSNPETPAGVPTDYRLLLAWSYYLASQAAWLSPMFQQQGQLPPSLPTNPQAAAKFLQQAMQTAMGPSSNAAVTVRNPHSDHEQMGNEIESKSNDATFTVVKEEVDES